MFKKKNCRKCGEKINSKHSFCPSCGNNLNNSKKEDWGMLGKNDSVGENFMPSFLGGGMFNKMVGSMMKMLEKEMKKDVKKINSPNSNFRLMINGKEIPLNQPQQKQIKKETKQIPLKQFTKEQSKKFSELAKLEPKTNIRRLSDKVIYEIEMPGINSTENISIIRLENSIEIKAIGKNKAYFKAIPISMPIISYDIEKGKLILELESNEAARI